MGIIEFLKTMSIRNKIKVISVFPLIFIIILSFFLNFNTYKKVNQLEDMKELANLNVKISLLLHETQKERGMSAGYIGSNGVKFKDNLTEQKELTNKNINEFKKTVQTLNSEIFPLSDSWHAQSSTPFRLHSQYAGLRRKPAGHGSPTNNSSGD